MERRPKLIVTAYQWMYNDWLYSDYTYSEDVVICCSLNSQYSTDGTNCVRTVRKDNRHDEVGVCFENIRWTTNQVLAPTDLSYNESHFIPTIVVPLLIGN